MSAFSDVGSINTLLKHDVRCEQAQAEREEKCEK